MWTEALTVKNNYDTIVSTLAAQDPVPWYQKPNLRRLYATFVVSVLCVETTSGYDSSMLNGLQAVAPWKTFFHNPHSTILGLISSMYALGAILAVPFVPYIADTYGRKRSVQLGSTLMIIGATIQTASQNLAMFMASRIIVGLGISFAIVAASALIGELSHPKERAYLGSLFNAFYFTGSVFAAAVTLGTFRMPNNWSWRIPSLLQVAPSACQMLFINFIPESPRWLCAKGRGSEALAILIKYHAEGDCTSEFVKAEYAQIQQTLSLEKETSKQSWRSLLETSGNRRRVLIASFLGLLTPWSGNGLITYFLSPILDNVGVHDNLTKNLVNLGNTLCGLVTAFSFAFVVSKFNRRTMYLTCTCSLLVIFTAWTIASARYAQTKSKASSRAVIAMIFLYNPAYNIAYNALTYTFLVEIFPFHIRAKGMSVFQWWSRAALFFNQFVNPIGIANIGWKFYISYCVFLAFEVMFIYFLFPETAKRSIEELAFLYEGDQMRAEQNKRIEQDMHEVHREEALVSTPSVNKASDVSHIEKA